MLPAAIPVLISAPLPTSIQFTLVLVASSIQPCPLQIMNGLVLRKNAMFTCGGAAFTIAGRHNIVLPRRPTPEPGGAS
jgi:hypothetical protein